MSRTQCAVSLRRCLEKGEFFHAQNRKNPNARRRWGGQRAGRAMEKERTWPKNEGEVSRTRAAEKFALISTTRVAFDVLVRFIFAVIPVHFGYPAYASSLFRCHVELGILLNE